MAQAAMTVRMDKDLKAQFEGLCEEFGMSINTAINVFVRAVVNRRSIPFEITDSKRIAGQAALNALYENRQYRVDNNLPELSLEEINAEINEVRNAQKTKAA